jgi:hypothetical protein
MRHVQKKSGIHVGLWWEHMKGGDHLEDLGIDGAIMFKWLLKE